MPPSLDGVAFLVSNRYMKDLLLSRWVLLLGIFLGCATLTEKPRLVPPTVTEDSSLPAQNLMVKGQPLRVHVKTFGNPADPVFFVMPGSLSDLRVYQIFASFQNSLFVVLWDQAGQGLSERVPASRLDFDHMVEEIRAMKQVYSPSQPVRLLGHSWSAVFAGLYAARYPADVSHLILLEPIGFYSEAMKGDQAQINLFTVGYLDMAWSGGKGAAVDHDSLDFQTLSMLRSKVRNFFKDIDNLPEWPVWRVGGLALMTWEALLLKNGVWDYDFRPGLNQFGGAVLLVGSEYSPIGASFQTQWNKPLFPAATPPAQVYKLEDSGHRMLTENWADLETAIKTFLGVP